MQADSLGRYTVLLSAMSPQGLPIELLIEGEARWLGVMVEGLPEQPRVLLVSVPYALKAGDAETQGGKPASAYLLSSQAETQTSTAATAGTLSGLITANGTNATTRGKASPQSITAGGTTNYLAAWLNANNLGASAIYQDPTTNNIGIGTAFSGGTLLGAGLYPKLWIGQGGPRRLSPCREPALPPRPWHGGTPPMTSDGFGPSGQTRLSSHTTLMGRGGQGRL